MTEKTETEKTEKKFDLASAIIQALTVLLLAAVGFYGRGIVSAQEVLLARLNDMDKRITVIESSHYTVAEAKSDIGILTGSIHTNAVNVASMNSKLDGIIDKLDYIIGDRGTKSIRE